MMMELEAFPAQFCKGVRSYWRRRKYQRLQGINNKNKTVAKLGGGRERTGKRRWRLRPAFRIRIKLFSPLRLLAKLRDAYVDAMLSLAGKGSSLTAPNAPEALWDRRVPRSRPLKSSSKKRDEFERRMIFEIYRALAASGELKRSE